MIRIAKLSYWHVHAWDYTRQAQANPATQIVAVWDELADRGQAAAEKQGVPFVADLHAILARPDVDAVIVDVPTNRHTEVMLAAARAGKHIFTEKVIAATKAECDQICAAVEHAGVKFMVSLPRLYEGYTLAIRKLIAEGTLGQVTLVRTRLSHNGALPNANSKDGWLPAHFYSKEQCQGGALIDLGCHPMYLTRLFLGQMPESLNATFGYITGRAVEDNAVATLRCANGAIGVVEAGFVNTNSPFVIEVHGTHGTALHSSSDGKVIYQRAGEKQWSEAALPANQTMAFDQWVEQITNGTSAGENVALACDLSSLMEAANRSAAEGRSIRLDELAG